MKSFLSWSATLCSKKNQRVSKSKSSPDEQSHYNIERCAARQPKRLPALPVAQPNGGLRGLSPPFSHVTKI